MTLTARNQISGCSDLLQKWGSKMTTTLPSKDHLSALQRKMVEKHPDARKFLDWYSVTSIIHAIVCIESSTLRGLVQRNYKFFLVWFLVAFLSCFAVIYKSRMLFWLTVEYYCGIYVYSTRNPVEYGFCTASSLYKPLPFIVWLPMIQRHICMHVITALHDYLLWVKGLSKKCSLWSNTCTLTYTFSFRSQMGSSYQSHDHGSVCMQPSMEAYTVLPNISVHRTGNDTKLPVYACSM